MSDPVLTDEEKGALLDGMASGEVEVHTAAGTTCASVVPFEIPLRSHLASNSYPRLARINQQLAKRAARSIEQMLNVEVEVTPEPVEVTAFGEFLDRIPALQLIVCFSAQPLDGGALLFLDGRTVGRLVETFFGGSRPDAATRSDDTLTQGEAGIGTRFSDEVLRAIGVAFEPVVALSPERQAVHLAADAVEHIEAGDTVIVSGFGLLLGDDTYPFHVAWPMSMFGTLLPVFEGRKRDRDAAEDARWGRQIRDRVTDSVVSISSSVGECCLTLRRVAALEPGDIIDIDNPRVTTVSAGGVPLLEGRFGVHDGRYAVETRNWLAPDAGAGRDPSAKTRGPATDGK